MKSLVCVLAISCWAAAALRAQQVGSGEKNPRVGSPAAIAEGRKIFRDSCQTCHGGDAKGGRGPALAYGNFQHGNEDWQLFGNIHGGIAGTQMPAFGQLYNDEVWAVVSYLRSLSGKSVEETVPGDPAAGAKLFEGKGGCAACHQVNGRGGRIGPDLSAVGRWSAKSLREAITDPNGREGRVPDVVVVKTRDGKEVRGIRKNEDTFSLQLMDTAERFHLLVKQDLADIRYDDKSLMPDDYGKRLSSDEMQDLIAYLKTLRVRDLDKVAAAPISGGLDFERLRNSQKEPQNWLTYWGDYYGAHFSGLAEISPSNVSRLQARWAFQLPTTGYFEATPLVVDGLMYTTGPNGYVFALDARSGRVIWQHQRRVKVAKAYEVVGNVNRGVAILGGRIYFTTIDAFLVALDAKTGMELWESQMAKSTEGYGATMAPLATRDRIISGISGGEFGVRGFLDAYDPATGKRLWRFNTIPGPGEFGRDTWAGESWKNGGGTTWMTGTYDPDTNILYWGVGNPAPDLNGDVRKGDNLFTSSIVALDAATGKRIWHFQFTPHDTHDWDSNETPVLVDRFYRGEQRKLLLHADRNAFFYVLDRTNGKFLMGKPFARQTWARGLDDSGKPILVDNWEASFEGQLHYPSLGGATNWNSPSYDPTTGWLFLAFMEAGDRYYKENEEFKAGKSYWGGKTAPAAERPWGGIKAINPETGNVEWEQKFHLGSVSAGVLATGGGVVFAGCRDGNLMAYDSRAGKLLWRFQVGSSIDSSPISYAVDGKQYVALSAGGVLYSFALPE